MKKLVSLMAAFFISAASSAFADSFFQLGLGLGSNYSLIEDNHELSFCYDRLYVGFKGFHTIGVFEDTDENGNKEINENYDTYIPTVFLGFHGDTFYITAGGNLIHYLMADYNSDISLPFCYPTLSLGWDIPVIDNYPHNGIINVDMSWYYCDLGDAWSQFYKSAVMFIPKVSVGFKYRYNF
ncbi:hypothetical protein [Treponema sp.]|uniref:hypothetical protein n=1 Tax=Treponema sp. TaxID=166 RepID=UPI002579AB0C|nr:hypothetical protein [Treponema sp.]MBE6355051.1 hypothetical protein [Treponema sp.]